MCITLKLLLSELPSTRHSPLPGTPILHYRCGKDLSAGPPSIQCIYIYIYVLRVLQNQLTAAGLSKGYSKFTAAGSDPNHLLLVKKLAEILLLG